jgi:rubredoxin
MLNRGRHFYTITTETKRVNAHALYTIGLSNDAPVCDFAGATFAEVDEAFSTQTCSACDSRSGPKGIAGLGIRAWTCGECGAVHDRNVNAAKNILAAGRRRLAEGIPAIQGAGGRQPKNHRVRVMI